MFKLSRIRHRIVRNASYSKNRQEWIPLGRTSKSLSEYELGQHFIHNQLNYRGLILVPIPHEKYVYDSTKKDYNISAEPVYLALVDQRDVNSQEGHLVTDIFKDGIGNLRAVEGFDLVNSDQVCPYNVRLEDRGLDQFGQRDIKASKQSFDFDNYWYRKFVYDFDGTPKETGNLNKWKYDYFNYDYLKTYERTHWPEGIRVSISPVFLGYNNRTQIKPKYCWKYHFKIELISQGYYELLGHSFHWQGSAKDYLSVDSGTGIYCGSDFYQGANTGKKHIQNIELTPSQPFFKFTSTKLLDYEAATFIGSLTFADHRGRETIVTLPSFNISIDKKKILDHQMKSAPAVQPTARVEKVNGNKTIISGVKVIPKDQSKSTKTDDSDEKDPK